MAGLGSRYRGLPVNLFSDSFVLRSQALLAATCAGALAGDSSVRAFDVANEIDDAQRPSSREAGRLWASVMAGAIREAAPGVPIQIGAHLPSLTTQNHMRVDDLAAIADEDVMHAYPLYSQSARSFLDPALVPFSCALTSGLSGSGRPTLMQEFGLCTASPGAAGLSITDDFLGAPRPQYLASEEEAATYYRGVLTRLVDTGAAGAYAWCYGDYDRTLFSRPPLLTAVRERTFGLVRADGTEKPAAGIFREFRRLHDTGKLIRGTVPRVIDVSADEYLSSSREALRPALCELDLRDGAVIASLERLPANPLIRPSQIGFVRASGSFNPGASVDHASGRVVLLVRVFEEETRRSCLALATSSDGRRIDEILDRPAVAREAPYEEWGVEDARITYLTEERRYAITYTGYSPPDRACA